MLSAAISGIGDDEQHARAKLARQRIDAVLTLGGGSSEATRMAS